MTENQEIVQESELTEKQEVVQNLLEAFNDTIDIAEKLRIDGEELESAKQYILGKILDACPEADPGMFIELTDGRWTLLAHIRKNPGDYVQLPDGRWASRDGDGVVKLR